MNELSQEPIDWFKQIVIPSPVTGESVPLNKVDSPALQLGAWGQGIAFIPRSQRIYLLPKWQCQTVSADRRDWVLVSRQQGVRLKLHLRIWSALNHLPFALQGTDSKTLCTLAPQMLQGSEPCYISLTLPYFSSGKTQLSWRPNYGKVTALNSNSLYLYLGAVSAADATIAE